MKKLFAMFGLVCVLKLSAQSAIATGTKVDSDAQTCSISPVAYGAKFDGQRANDCATIARNTNLTCASSHFVPGDAGKSISISFAGPTVTAALTATGYSIASNVVTFQAANSLAAGTIVAIPST